MCTKFHKKGITSSTDSLQMSIIEVFSSSTNVLHGICYRSVRDLTRTDAFRQDKKRVRAYASEYRRQIKSKQKRKPKKIIPG